MRAKVCFMFGFCLSAPLFAQTKCVLPRDLEIRVKAHPGAENYSEVGSWFGDHRQFDCAAMAFQKALENDPKSAKLNYLLGLSLYSSGRIAAAIPPLMNSIATEPQVVKSRLLLASALAHEHLNREAEEQWKAALTIDPKSSIALDGLSKLLLDDGDYVSVIDLLRSEPLDEALAFDLAMAYGRAGMLDDAATVLAGALEKYPASLEVTNALVSVYVKQTRFQEASRLAEAAYRHHPGSLEAEKLYLRVLVLNGDFDTARPLAHKLLAAAPHDFDALYLNGVLEHQAGDDLAARNHLEEAVQLDPKHYNARYNLGITLARLHDAEGARKQLEKAIELGASEPELRFELAKVLRSLGETDKAQQQLKLYQEELKARANRTVAAQKSGQAEQEMNQGNAQKAVTLYREALEATPNNAMLAYKLAMALDSTGNLEDERSVLEQATKLDVDFALAQNQLGYVLSRLGNLQGAEEHFRQALRSAPDYLQAWINLAATLGMQSRFAEAQQAAARALALNPGNEEAKHLMRDLTAAGGVQR
jgi:tetratricopeptide (TPR) repeat protein